ncbi:MAG: hypothetical protein HC876_11540 [Chloroflexaceae bacterium]|nr:hypothetical protein [Chloroflexaceae bacterium]
MWKHLLRSSFVIGLAIICAGLLVGSKHNVAAYAPDIGRPDNVVLDISSRGAPELSSTGNYLSPITEADRPFTHLMLKWRASGPVSDTLVLEVRTSRDGESWGDWLPVWEDYDMWEHDDGTDVFWSQITYAGDGARFWQVRATMIPTASGDEAILHTVEVNTVDGRYAADQAPTFPETSLAGLAKPPVVSRTAWGNPDGQGSRVSPAYYPVNHVIVHHTVDPNTFRSGEKNWGDRVRAIWSFHTFTRGWGDVGYNYLVTPDGTIYEGRAGGDDAVGFHDTGNYGSMGVALVGTFDSVNPTGAAQDSLVALLGWKADQKQIDPLGRSYYYGCDISSYCSSPGPWSTTSPDTAT